MGQGRAMTVFAADVELGELPSLGVKTGHMAAAAILAPFVFLPIVGLVGRPLFRRHVPLRGQDIEIAVRRLGDVLLLVHRAHRQRHIFQAEGQRGIAAGEVADHRVRIVGHMLDRLGVARLQPAFVAIFVATETAHAPGVALRAGAQALVGFQHGAQPLRRLFAVTGGAALRHGVADLFHRGHVMDAVATETVGQRCAFVQRGGVDLVVERVVRVVTVGAGRGDGGIGVVGRGLDALR